MTYLDSQSLANLTNTARSYCGPFSESRISGISRLANTDSGERSVSKTVKDAK